MFRRIPPWSLFFKEKNLLTNGMDNDTALITRRAAHLGEEGLEPENAASLAIEISRRALDLNIKEHGAVVEATQLQDEKSDIVQNLPADASGHPVTGHVIMSHLHTYHSLLLRAWLFIAGETLLLAFFLQNLFIDFPYAIVCFVSVTLVFATGFSLEKYFKDGSEDKVRKKRETAHSLFAAFMCIGLITLGLSRSLYMLNNSSVTIAQTAFILSTLSFSVFSMGLSLAFTLASVELGERYPVVPMARRYKRLQTLNRKTGDIMKQVMKAQLEQKQLRSAALYGAMLGVLKAKKNKNIHYLFVLVFLFSSFYCSGCNRANPLGGKKQDANVCMVFFIDVSASSSGTQGQGLKDTLSKVDALLKTSSCAERIVISKVGTLSFGINNIFLDETIPPYANSPFGIDCKRKKEEIAKAFQRLTLTLKAFEKATDVIGSTHLLSQLSAECPYPNVHAFFFSDMRHYTKQTFDFNNFVNAPGLSPEDFLQARVINKRILPHFPAEKRITVHIARFHNLNITASGFNWITDFWSAYFQKAGAKEVAFSLQ